MRLQKYMALCGVASRRASEEMIAAGRVTVDGKADHGDGHAGGAGAGRVRGRQADIAGNGKALRALP